MKNCLPLLLAAVCISLASPAHAADAPTPPAAPTPTTGSIGGGVANPWRGPGRTTLADISHQSRFIP